MRWLLGGLLAFMALNALGGGWYGLAGAEGVPTEWLAGSPFRDYTLPSLILLIAVGGACGAAAFLVLRRSRLARPAALAAGAVLVGWIGAQVAIIGWVSWLQPAVLVTGIGVLAIAFSGRR